ncbi:hypothetical protein [Saezia sanguinis]|uniref:hypothetical protein n=1 Tax=Saezia sanguinis TaxID=1965230 RepID=UPI0030D6EE3A
MAAINMKGILKALCIFCIGCYLLFFVIAFFAHFIAVCVAYQKIGVFKYVLTWDLVAEHAKFALIGFPIGLVLFLARLREIKTGRH